MTTYTYENDYFGTIQITYDERFFIPIIEQSAWFELGAWPSDAEYLTVPVAFPIGVKMGDLLYSSSLDWSNLAKYELLILKFDHPISYYGFTPSEFDNFIQSRISGCVLSLPLSTYESIDMTQSMLFHKSTWFLTTIEFPEIKYYLIMTKITHKDGSCHFEVPVTWQPYIRTVDIEGLLEQGLKPHPPTTIWGLVQSKWVDFWSWINELLF